MMEKKKTTPPPVPRSRRLSHDISEPDTVRPPGQGPRANKGSGIWSRPFFPDGDLRQQAVSLILSHVETSESGRPAPGELAGITERDLRNAIEVLKLQMVKDDTILRTLAYLAAASPYENIRALAKEAIERNY
jgi:hypothetical protein